MTHAFAASLCKESNNILCKISCKNVKKHSRKTRTYYAFRSPLNRVQGHQVLAINRGEDIAGFAASKSKTKIVIEGGRAGIRFKTGEPFALIVRAKDNKADPMSIVRIFRMKSTKKNRSAVISAVGSFAICCQPGLDVV